MSSGSTTAPRTVAVTGSTGFLGLAVTRALLGAGDRVVALVRPSTDRSLLPVHDELSVVEYSDLADPVVADHLATFAPDAFLHLGWAGVAGSDRGRIDHVAANVPTTIASVRLAAATGCTYWLGCGSQAEYGPRDDVRTEDTPLRPATDYGFAKVAAAAAAHATGDALALATGWARVFSLYGSGDHAGAVLPYTISALLRDEAPQLGPCDQDWDFLHVDDAADAFIALVRSGATGPFNIASGDAAQLRDTIELAAELVAGTARPAFGDASAPPVPLRASRQRITERTGWAPRISLHQGLRETVEHLRSSLPLTSNGAAT